MTEGIPFGDQSSRELFSRLANEYMNDLAAQLDAGVNDELRAYFSAMSRFHRYSIRNIMLILKQRPDSTRVASVRTWRSLDRTVKQGEIGIVIAAPLKLSGGKMAFRAARVFDVLQTEGTPLPQPPHVRGDPGIALARLEAAIRAAGVTIKESAQPEGFRATSGGGVISLHRDLAPAERFSVLVHEWTHLRLHPGRSADSAERTVRETEAEAVAYVVNRFVGLRTGTVSADYIRLYGGDKRKLAASLDQIQRTAGVVIEAIADHSRPKVPKNRDQIRNARIPPKQR